MYAHKLARNNSLMNQSSDYRNSTVSFNFILPNVGTVSLYCSYVLQVTVVYARTL